MSRFWVSDPTSLPKVLGALRGAIASQDRCEVGEHNAMALEFAYRRAEEIMCAATDAYFQAIEDRSVASD